MSHYTNYCERQRLVVERCTGQIISASERHSDRTRDSRTLRSQSSYDHRSRCLVDRNRRGPATCARRLQASSSLLCIAIAKWQRETLRSERKGSSGKHVGVWEVFRIYARVKTDTRDRSQASRSVAEFDRTLQDATSHPKIFDTTHEICTTGSVCARQTTYYRWCTLARTGRITRIRGWTVRRRNSSVREPGSEHPPSD